MNPQHVVEPSLDETDTVTEAWLTSVQPPANWDPRPAGSPPAAAGALGNELVATVGLKQLRAVGELSCCESLGTKLGDNDPKTLAMWAMLSESDAIRNPIIATVKSRVLNGVAAQTASSAARVLEAASHELDLLFDASQPCRRPRRLVREFFRVKRPACWVW